MALFYPSLYRRRITDVTAEDLHRLGARGVLLDVDNTLTTHDAPDLAEDVKMWLATMKAQGFALVIVSNNSPERVAPFAAKIGLPYSANARKPLPVGYRAASTELQVPLKECVAIGDQIFTDVLGANLARISSILLEPIQPEVDQKFIAFKRKIEGPMLNTRKQKERREKDYGVR